MAVVDTSYMNATTTPVKDFSDFIGSGLPEIPKLKSLVTAIKGVFKAQDVQLQLYFIEGRRYKVEIYTSRMKKQLVAIVYYVVASSQVHIYDSNQQLLIASDKKKVIYDAVPYTINYIGGADRLRVVLQAV